MRPASSFLDVARTLAIRAAEHVEVLRRSPLVQERKADHSLVTNADKEADAIIRSGLRKAFPDHAILTEESGMEGDPGAEYVWLVDPIDGTKAFAAGIPGYSVMIGLLKHGQPYAGVVVDPLEGHLYEALKGDGTFYTLRNVRQRVRVSERKEYAHMPVMTSTGFPKASEELFKPVLSGPWIPAFNSVGIKVGLVVRRQVDIYINHHGVHLWDTGAPQIILEEAGGVFTYWNGATLDYPLDKNAYRHPFETLATNGQRHDDVLKIIRRHALSE